MNRRKRCAAVFIAVGVLGVGSVTSAGATIEDLAINGTFRAFSDGQWAKKNEIYLPEPPVTSIWTFTSTCSTVHDCTGHVVSDLGWTATARYISKMWFVTHEVPNWVRCADGTTPPGQQMFKFYEDPANPGTYKGWDNTVGPSGACGINLPLAMELPFTLVPV